MEPSMREFNGWNRESMDTLCRINTRDNQLVFENDLKGFNQDIVDISVYTYGIISKIFHRSGWILWR